MLYMMNSCTPYIIVYSKNLSRYQNYLEIKKHKIPNIKYFEAVDTITDNGWNKWKVESIEHKLSTEGYITEIGDKRGNVCKNNDILIIGLVY